MIKGLIRGFRSRSFTLANWLSSQRACEAYRQGVGPLRELGPTLPQTVLNLPYLGDGHELSETQVYTRKSGGTPPLESLDGERRSETDRPTLDDREHR